LQATSGKDVAGNIDIKKKRAHEGKVAAVSAYMWGSIGNLQQRLRISFGTITRTTSREAERHGAKSGLL
jgi:hypothetical protein